MSEFTEYVKEVFNLFGEVSCRKMFGGYGVYHNGVMFALIADDIIYLKADKTDEEHFQERDLPPFEYERKGKMIALSYYLAPDEIYDDPVEAEVWARRAYQSAMRAKAQGGKK